jgi:hypothetical protein
MFTLMYIAVGLTVAYLLAVWYKSDAIVEYGRMLPLSWQEKLKINDYAALSVDDPQMTYAKFLNRYVADNFFTRLLECEICLSLWLSLFINVAVYSAKFLSGLDLATALLSIAGGTFPAAMAGLIIYAAWLKVRANGTA